MTKNRALFLDRDGVINVNYGYVHRKGDFHFIEGIFELAAAATARGFLPVVVTNQSGIGRGYYSERQFNRLMQWVCLQFKRRRAPIAGVYFCPYHPEHGVGRYRRDSPFRKPRPGMLLKAARELHIDLERSVIVGDSASDMKAGAAAGVGRLFYLRSDETAPLPELPPEVRIVRSLTAIVPELNF